MKEQIKKLQIVEKILRKSKGNFELFAISLRDNSPNKWDLLISADWARENERESINIIAEELKKVFSSEEFLMLSRIIILDKDDTIQSSTQNAITIYDGVAEISNSDFLGLPVKHAYLISSPE